LPDLPPLEGSLRITRAAIFRCTIERRKKLLRHSSRQPLVMTGSSPIRPTKKGAEPSHRRIVLRLPLYRLE
jgi:hypothetical protein